LTRIRITRLSSITTILLLATTDSSAMNFKGNKIEKYDLKAGISGYAV
jgi:hypothetical protein